MTEPTTTGPGSPSKAKPDQDPLDEGIRALQDLANRLGSFEQQMTHMERLTPELMRHMKYLAFQRVRPFRMEVERVIMLLKKPQREKQAIMAKLKKAGASDVGRAVQ